jgi:hypothetical protein
MTIYPRKRIVFISLIGVFLCHAIIAGARLPNLWATTHWLLDYEFGFIKRGLAGEVLTWFAGPKISYYSIAGLSLVITLLNLILFVWYSKDLIIPANLWLILALIASPGFFYHFYWTGYFDQVGFLIAALCLFFPMNWIGLAWTAAFCSIGILIHEGFYLMWAPIILFRHFLDFIIGHKSNLYFIVLITIAGGLTILTYLLSNTTLSAEHLDLFTNHISSKAADFQIRWDVAYVPFLSGESNLIIMKLLWPMDGLLSPRVVLMAMVTLFYLPFPIFITYLSVRQIKYFNIESNWRREILLFGVIIGSLSPLLLNIFGYDIWRFSAATHFTSVFVFIILNKSRDEKLGKKVLQPPMIKFAALCFIFFNLMVEPVNKDLRRPPYVESWAKIYDKIQNERPLVSPPKLEPDEKGILGDLPDRIVEKLMK